MRLEGRKPRAPYTRRKVKKIVTSWHIYMLTSLYVQVLISAVVTRRELIYHRLFNNGAAGAVPVFAQYLKASKHPKYTIPQINNYPTTTYAVQIVTTLAYAWASDSFLNGDRLPPIIFGAVSLKIPSALPVAATTD